jgi:hypothetical protein
MLEHRQSIAAGRAAGAHKRPDLQRLAAAPVPGRLPQVYHLADFDPSRAGRRDAAVRQFRLRRHLSANPAGIFIRLYAR